MPRVPKVKRIFYKPFAPYKHLQRPEKPSTTAASTSSPSTEAMSTSGSSPSPSSPRTPIFPLFHHHIGTAASSPSAFSIDETLVDDLKAAPSHTIIPPLFYTSNDESGMTANAAISPGLPSSPTIPLPPIPNQPPSIFSKAMVQQEVKFLEESTDTKTPMLLSPLPSQLSTLHSEIELLNCQPPPPALDFKASDIDSGPIPIEKWLADHIDKNQIASQPTHPNSLIRMVSAWVPLPTMIPTLVPALAHPLPQTIELMEQYYLEAHVTSDNTFQDISCHVFLPINRDRIMFWKQSSGIVSMCWGEQLLPRLTSFENLKGILVPSGIAIIVSKTHFKITYFEEPEDEDNGTCGPLIDDAPDGYEYIYEEELEDGICDCDMESCGGGSSRGGAEDFEAIEAEFNAAIALSSLPDEKEVVLA